MKYVKRNFDWKLRTIGNSIFVTNSIRVFQINMVTARLAQSADGKRNRNDIIDHLLTEFTSDSTPVQARNDLNEMMEQLLHIGIITEVA